MTRIAVIDFETTGISPSMGDRATEVAIVVTEGGRVVERVEVAPERVERYPIEAIYRNLTAFRELKLVRQSLRVVEAFDPDIWDPAE